MTALQERVAALLGQEGALFLPTATMANQIALKLHSRPGDVLVAERHAHVVIYEYGGAAVHAGLLVEAIPGVAGRITPEQLRAVAEPSTKAADQRAAVLALEDTHNSSGGRCWPLDELDDGRRHRARARPVGAPRRRAAAQRRRRSGCAAGGDRRALRHRDGVPVERARLPARRGARGLAGAAGAGVAREAPLRRRHAPGRDRRRGRRSTRSTTTSSGSPTTTLARGAWRRPGTRPACPSSSTRSRRTSSSSTSEQLGLPVTRRWRGSARRRGALLDDPSDVLRAVTHLDVTDDDIDAGVRRSCPRRTRPG